MILDIIILFVSIVNVILTLFVFLNAKELKQHSSFLIFSFVTTLWLIDDFLLRIYPNTIYSPLSYGLGILVATGALLWVYNLVEEKVPRVVWYILMPISMVVFLVSSFSNAVILSQGSKGHFGAIGGQKGVLFSVYALYIGGLILCCLYKLAKKSFEESDSSRKKQVRLLFFGGLIFGACAFLVNFFIPLVFNSFELADLVTIAYLPLVLSIGYAMVKHSLFGAKIVMTQFLIALFLSLLFLNFMLSDSSGEIIRNGLILIVSLIISYCIVKSVLNEMKHHAAALEETQKNLDIEQRLRKTFAEISGETLQTLKDSIFNKTNSN